MLNIVNQSKLRGQQGGDAPQASTTFLGLLKQEAGKQGLTGVSKVLTDDTTSKSMLSVKRGEEEGDDVRGAPLAQSRWFQASAKVVRMSVLEHLERDKARNHVSEQLRVWASEKVQQYSKVRAPTGRHRSDQPTSSDALEAVFHNVSGKCGLLTAPCSSGGHWKACADGN